MVSAESAFPAQLMIIEGERGPLDYLSNDWPISELAQVHVTIIGVGSIGSTTAEILAMSAVGQLSLVDPDRLEQRNLARHRRTDVDLGRLKAVAMRDWLHLRYPSTIADAYPLDVIRDADVMRPLFAASDVIVCSADGVAARRVTNHLARRASVPAVFAAVLEDGAFGELLRVRGRTGCLLCHRRALSDAGAFDPEPGLELGYGTGNPHRPMTAAPGDLAWMGTAAAKAAIATVLERRGRWHQRLPGDSAIVGLQPVPEMPRPFNIEHAGEIRWELLPPPHPDCPTCAPP